MKRFIWNLEYATRAMMKLKCSPKLVWDLATATDGEVFEKEYPKEALEIELSCWDGEV